MNSFFKIYKNLKKNEKNKFYLIFIFMFFLIILELFSLALFLPLISLIISDNNIPLLGDISFINNLDRFEQIIFFLILIICAFIFKNLFYAYLIYFRK